PDVEFLPILTDALAMHLLYRPTSFDVVVTDNLFGDLVTDEAAALAGSMGLMPSASFGSARNRHGGYRGIYEPIHGTAPDIGSKGLEDAEEPAGPRILAVGLRVEAAQPGQPELRLDAVQRLTPALQAEIDLLAEAARAVDGVRPFGEHKWLRLVRGDDRCAALLLRRGEELVGAAHCDAYHVGPSSGACRVTAELVVHPNYRGQGLGRRLLAG